MPSVIYIQPGGGGGSTTLNALTDVTVVTALTGTSLAWNGTSWIQYPAPGGWCFYPTAWAAYAGGTSTTSVSATTSLVLISPPGENYGRNLDGILQMSTGSILLAQFSDGSGIADSEDGSLRVDQLSRVLT
jgi:hypothetical protein